MLIGYKRGQGSIILRVKILDSSVTTGAGKTGMTNVSSGLIISTVADNEATATAYTAAAGNIETISTLGTYAAPTSGKCRFKEVDATNHKGIYELQFADARYAVSSAKSLLVSISGVTNAAETDLVIPLLDINPYSDTTKADLVSIDGQLTNGNNATLNLKKLSVVNDVGDAVEMKSTVGSGDYSGLVVSGPYGAKFKATVSGGYQNGGTGLWIEGGSNATWGYGVFATAAGAAAMYLSGNSGGGTKGLFINSSGDGISIAATNGTGGKGISVASSSTNPGIDVSSPSGNGIKVRGGSRLDIDANLIGQVSGNVTGSVGSLAIQAKADVNTEVTSALNAWGGGGGGGGSSTLATGTVVSTTGTTTTLDSGSEAAARYYVGARLVISSGAGAGQERIITEYSVGRVATHAVWETNPDLNSTYEIQPARISLTDADGTGLITNSSALASEVAICNLALSHINVAKGIANLETEKSVEAIALRRFYDIARDNALRDYPWPFATKIASLALVQANPNDEWDYAYRYPTDCLNIRRIVSGTGDISKDLEIRYKISRDDSGILILTDQADATIEYTIRETDPTRYPADFVLAFSLQLAHYVAPVLTAGDPFKLGERAMSLYLYQIEKAKSSASNEQKDEQKIDSEFLRSRE